MKITSRFSRTPPATIRRWRQQHRLKLHCDHVLHVERAAAVDETVDDLAAERVLRPLVALDGDDVSVGHEQQGFVRAVAPQAGDDRCAIGGRADGFTIHAVTGEDAADVVGREDLASRRVARVEPEQRLEVS
jgi:hypothetical protein